MGMKKKCGSAFSAPAAVWIFFLQPRLKDYPYAKLTAVCVSCEALRNKTAQYLSANGFQSRCHAEGDAFSGGASEPGSQLTLGGK